nr:MAG TPA: hypothetical protein [Bacteriophage sp.]
MSKKAKDIREYKYFIQGDKCLLVFDVTMLYVAFRFRELYKSL